MARPLSIIIEDMLDAIEQAYEFTADTAHEEFRSDRKTQRAVERCLEILSEASRGIPQDIKDKYPHIPWRNVADSGNVFRHVYHSIAVDIVWDTVKVHLPPLEAVMLEIQAGLPDEEEDPVPRA